MASPRRIRTMIRALHAAGWAIACTGIGLLTLEATIRADDWSQHGVPVQSGYTAIGELVVRDSLGMHARPGAHYRQFRINSLGYRGDEIDPEMLHQRPVVVTTGASETFGLYESPQREWPRQLGDSVEGRCAIRPIVLNAAFAGMSLPTLTNDVRRRVSEMSPSVVVLYPTPLQYVEGATPPGAAATTDRPEPPPPWWRLRAPTRFRDAVKASIPAVVLDRLRRIQTTRSRRASGSPFLSAPPEDRLDAFEADLRAFIGTTRSIGAIPVLVVHRHRFGPDTTSAEDQRWLRAWEKFHPRAPAHVLLEFEALAAERVRRVAVDSAVAVADPGPALTTAGPAAFADYSHFTDSGAAAVASSVAPLVAHALGCADRPRR